VGEAALREAAAVAAAVREELAGRVFWNVNSTAHGGGVAEMLRALLPYVRGFGIDTRWIVLRGTPKFFRITKRLHHALHGSLGDGSAITEKERRVYERISFEAAEDLLSLVRPGDFVLLHDPQTAGLAPYLVNAGAIVIWRCHIGTESPNEETETAWAFLEPYLTQVHAAVFTREQYIPSCCDRRRSVIIPPSIDPFSPKNQELDTATVRAILVHTGLLEGPIGVGTPTFFREDGSPGRVDRHADVVRLGRAPQWDTALIVQVSRWDTLKDPAGVINGFVEFAHLPQKKRVELVLAGPNVNAVPDDPEQAAVFNDVVALWRTLPHALRDRVHLACLPMADAEENAAIVNALQRHAAVVVQKSLQEGFGLTVTEAMWKARPVVASAVGGIQDQIEHKKHGLLVKDPRNLTAFAQALHKLIEDPDYATALGTAARERVRQRYLPTRHLLQYAELIKRIDR
jgi:trehalose synthase